MEDAVGKVLPVHAPVAPGGTIRPCGVQVRGHNDDGAGGTDRIEHRTGQRVGPGPGLGAHCDDRFVVGPLLGDAAQPCAQLGRTVRPARIGPSAGHGPQVEVNVRVPQTGHDPPALQIDLGSVVIGTRRGHIGAVDAGAADHDVMGPAGRTGHQIDHPRIAKSHDDHQTPQDGRGPRCPDFSDTLSRRCAPWDTMWPWPMTVSPAMGCYFCAAVGSARSSRPVPLRCAVVCRRRAQSRNPLRTRILHDH